MENDNLPKLVYISPDLENMSEPMKEKYQNAKEIASYEFVKVSEVIQKSFDLMLQIEKQELIDTLKSMKDEGLDIKDFF